MRYSIVHPSRGRPQKALDNALNWIGKYSGDDDLEYIVSLDQSDPFLKTYTELFNGTGITLVTANNLSMVDACNTGAKLTSGDIIVLVSDDFDCPFNWDRMLTMYAQSCETPCFLIQVKDGYSDGKRLTTIPILSRPLYARLGYIYNPIYHSMWADNDLYEVCDSMGVLVNCPVLFKHYHWANGLRRQDDTDRQHSSDKLFEAGQRIFEQRKKEGFKP